MDNNSNCTILIHLTVNSLQGDSQLVCQDILQPTEGSWGEGASTDYNLFCWLEAVITLMIMFLQGGQGQWVATARWVAHAHPAQQPMGIWQLLDEDVWGEVPFSTLPKVLPGHTGIPKARAHLRLSKGDNQSMPVQQRCLGNKAKLLVGAAYHLNFLARSVSTKCIIHLACAT